MKDIFNKYSFKVTPVFNYIIEQTEQAGLHINHFNNAKQSLQLFRNKESYEKNELYIGAIQYEGSSNFEEKEPHLVSWRFKRANISSELKQELESITSFRRDKNTGPAVNPKAESIAFKFENLNEQARETMKDIVKILRGYTEKVG